MQAINILDTSTKIADPGNRDFIHIHNNSDTTIYLTYDGSVAATVAGGIPLAAGGKMTLDNIGPRNIFTKAVYGIHAAAGQSKEVRVQGV